MAGTKAREEEISRGGVYERARDTRKSMGRYIVSSASRADSSGYIVFESRARVSCIPFERRKVDLPVVLRRH